MRIMAVGDVVGRSGRRAFYGENAAHGKGLTYDTFMELLSGGADIVTSGNHIWDNRDVMRVINQEPFLIRPANYPEGVPGKGFCIYPHRDKNIGVLNLSGRTFMPALDCPFSKAMEIVRRLKMDCDIILLDFHAEATSEKMAMGFYLDGKVTAVWGTHTHVQTADERTLPKGTAYITDLGMVGALDSILGVKPEPVIEKFLTEMPVKFDVAEGPCIYNGVILDIDNRGNYVTDIERICDEVQV